MQQVLSIRAASEQDADAIAALSAEFDAYLAALGDPAPRGITAAEYRRDGFGEHPAFAGLVAEDAGHVVAYLLYHPALISIAGATFGTSSIFSSPNALAARGSVEH